MRRDMDVKLRLGEITRRSVELSATSSKLANLASQLDQLRKLSARAEKLPLARHCAAGPKYDQFRIFGLRADDRDTT
jgi:hypothetical protein